MPDYYKSIRAPVTICATLVNTQTDRHIDSRLLTVVLLALHYTLYCYWFKLLPVVFMCFYRAAWNADAV